MIKGLYRGTNEFEKDYQPRTKLVKQEDCDFLSDFDEVKELLCQLLNEHRANNVRKTKIHKPEPLLPETSYFKVEIAVEKFKRCKSPGRTTDQIPAELIQAGGNTLRSEIQKITNLISKKELACLVTTPQDKIIT
jgi:hypothetical protein